MEKPVSTHLHLPSRSRCTAVIITVIYYYCYYYEKCVQEFSQEDCMQDMSSDVGVDAKNMQPNFKEK
jgi:hypothetical protein